MYDNIVLVVLALERNQYYPDGDLVRFGNTTLLEWTIPQVLGVTSKENIYVLHPPIK